MDRRAEGRGIRARRGMPLNLTYKHGPAMSVVEVSGLAFADQATQALEAIREATHEHGVRRLLIDLTDVVGTLGEREHKALGLLVVQYLSHLERVASLVPEDKITRISEAAARSRGMELRVFTGLTGAVSWLLEQPPG
jgi:hypothetical protein